MKDNLVSINSQRYTVPIIYSIPLIILLFIGSELNAQKHNFKAGIFTGIAKVNNTGETHKFWHTTDYIEYNVCTTSGLFVKRNISQSQYFLFELRYIRKGSIRALPLWMGIPNYERLKLDYLELPVHFGSEIYIYKRKLFLEVGIGLARLIQSQFYIEIYDVNQKFYSENKLKNSDISGILKLIFPTGFRERMGYEVRISKSLISIHKEYNVRNYCLCAGIRYQL